MPSPRPWAAVSALALAVAVGTMQLTVVVPLLPALQRELGVPLTTASWAVTAGLLSGAIAIPVLARLGDAHGRRPVLVVALGLLTGGSLLAALAPGLPWLLTGRVLQGFAAALLPLAVGLARQLLPAHRLPGAIGLLSATIGAGSGGGLILAGLLGSDHRAVFWALAVLGLASGALVLGLVRPAERPTGGRPDVPGAVLLSAALTGLLLVTSRGATWGWTSTPTLGLAAATLVAAAGWVLTARRTPAPLIPVEMLVDRRTAAATGASFLLGFALFGLITGVSTHAQAEGATVLQVGVLLLPTTVLMLAFSVAAGPLLRRFPASALVAAGSVAVAAAGMWLVVVPATAGATGLLGIGIGLGYGALGTMAVQHVDPAETATASGINALVRLVGSAVAGVVAPVLLTAAGPPAALAAPAFAALLAGLVSTAGRPGRTRPRVAAGEHV